MKRSKGVRSRSDPYQNEDASVEQSDATKVVTFPYQRFSRTTQKTASADLDILSWVSPADGGISHTEVGVMYCCPRPTAEYQSPHHPHQEIKINSTVTADTMEMPNADNLIQKILLEQTPLPTRETVTP